MSRFNAGGVEGWLQSIFNASVSQFNAGGVGAIIFQDQVIDDLVLWLGSYSEEHLLSAIQQQVKK